MFSNNDMFKTPEGYIGIVMHKGGTYDVTTDSFSPDTEIIEKAEFPNLIVNKASVLMARRMAPGSAVNVNTGANIADGLQYLAVGTGVGTGTTQNPEAAVLTQTVLRTELFRKEFTSWTFVDAAGNNTNTPTNILKLATTFLEAEAVGALVEMGLFGGDATATRDSGHMFNYKTFPVNNIQAA